MREIIEWSGINYINRYSFIMCLLAIFILLKKTFITSKTTCCCHKLALFLLTYLYMKLLIYLGSNTEHMATTCLAPLDALN